MKPLPVPFNLLVMVVCAWAGIYYGRRLYARGHAIEVQKKK